MQFGPRVASRDTNASLSNVAPTIVPTVQDGKKKAVLIGINYVGTRNELKGCGNDIIQVRRQLLAKGFLPEDVVIISDVVDAELPNAIRPTRSNIANTLTNEIGHTKAGDEMVVWYSGHGSNLDNETGSEVDDEDETWCALDDDDPTKIAQIRDNDIRGWLHMLALGALGVFVSDSCHSGSVMDAINNFGKAQTLNRKVLPHGFWFGISACLDDQTDADDTYQAEPEKEPQPEGAGTSAWLNWLSKNGGWDAFTKVIWSRDYAAMAALKNDFNTFMAGKYIQRIACAFEGFLPGEKIASGYEYAIDNKDGINLPNPKLNKKPAAVNPAPIIVNAKPQYVSSGKPQTAIPGTVTYPTAGAPTLNTLTGMMQQLNMGQSQNPYYPQPVQGQVPQQVYHYPQAAYYPNQPSYQPAASYYPNQIGYSGYTAANSAYYGSTYPRPYQRDLNAGLEQSAEVAPMPVADQPIVQQDPKPGLYWASGVPRNHYHGRRIQQAASVVCDPDLQRINSKRI